MEALRHGAKLLHLKVVSLSSMEVVKAWSEGNVLQVRKTRYVCSEIRTGLGYSAHTESVYPGAYRPAQRVLTASALIPS